MNKKSNEEVQITDKRPGIGGKPATVNLEEAYTSAPSGLLSTEFRPSQAKPGLTTLSFSDLSDEQYRVYVWPNGWKVTLYLPTRLNVSASGGHRVYTDDGISHYIPSGWNHLYWKVKENCPHFAF